MDALVRWADADVSTMGADDLREYAVALKKTMNPHLVRYRLLRKILAEVERELETR